jgi:hypothetical protein
VGGDAEKTDVRHRKRGKLPAGGARRDQSAGEHGARAPYRRRRGSHDRPVPASVDGNEPSTLVRLCEGLSDELKLESVLEPAADVGRAPQSPEPWGVDGRLLTNRGPDIRLRSTAGQQERRASSR